MKKRVLMIGANKRNNCISQYFARKGFYPIIIEDVYKLRSLEGEVGCFRAKLKDEEIQADVVVLTEQPTAPPVMIDGLATWSVYENATEIIKSKTNRTEPIVFLLDYICESPLSASICALSEAKALALRKRQVYYAAKFIRTAGIGIEKLYREAREAGVTFIKYEEIELSGNEDSQEFSIKISDGVLELPIQTTTLFVDGSLEVGQRFSYVTEKLKLMVNELGRLTEEFYYLTPALTGRRGVYYISPDLASEKLLEGLEYIVALASSGIWREPLDGVALVDGEKCVLCLNCLRACTHGALTPDTVVRQMSVLGLACEGCGSCGSVCPGNAISLEREMKGNNAITLEWKIKGNNAVIIEQELNKTSINEESNFSEKQDQVLVLCCENSAAVAIEKALPLLGKDAARIETRSAPCGGKIGLEQLTDDLLSYHKIMVAVCMNDACRHFDGNKRACGQVTRLKQMLERLGLSSESIRITYTSHVMPKVLRDDLIDFIKGDSF